MVVFKLYYQHIVRVENQTRLKAKNAKYQFSLQLASLTSFCSQAELFYFWLI